jgi:hypothetical protein
MNNDNNNEWKFLNLVSDSFRSENSTGSNTSELDDKTFGPANMSQS